MSRLAGRSPRRCPTKRGTSDAALHATTIRSATAATRRSPRRPTLRAASRSTSGKPPSSALCSTSWTLSRRPFTPPTTCWVSPAKSVASPSLTPRVRLERTQSTAAPQLDAPPGADCTMTRRNRAAALRAPRSPLAVLPKSVRGQTKTYTASWRSVHAVPLAREPSGRGRAAAPLLPVVQNAAAGVPYPGRTPARDQSSAPIPARVA